jgi:hypothetical protein
MMLTHDAGKHLKELLETAGFEDGVVVRFVFGFQGIELEPSVVFPGDTTYDFEGRTVLAVDRHLATALSGRTLLFRDTGEGIKLDLK